MNYIKKTNYILHSVTIINILLVWKLAARYRFTTILSMLSLIVVIPYFYTNQSVVFQKNVHFRVEGDKIGISDLIQGQATSLSSAEVLGMVNTYEFATSLARKLYRSKIYSELNFSHPMQSGEKDMLNLLACKEAECSIAEIRKLLVNLYVVNPEGTAGRFSLKVSTRSRETTMEIIKTFQEALEDLRFKNAQALAERQVSQLKELIVKSKSDIEKKDGFAKVTSADFLDALISQHKEKIRTLINRLIKDDSDFNNHKFKLKESNIASEMLIDSKDKLGFESYSKIKRRIEEIQQNIASINSTPVENRTETDSLILSKLKEELNLNESELRKMGVSKRNLARDDSFINLQKGNKSELEFDYKVTGAQVKKLTDQYKKATEELDDLYSRKANLENELVALKPDLEYLKLLETKLVTLKFKQSSVSSDVSFEEYGNDVLVFKRNSLIKIAAFSFILVAFLLFFIIIILYLLDDRIFEELEIDRCVENLPIIGNAPHFE